MANSLIMPEAYLCEPKQKRRHPEHDSLDVAEKEFTKRVSSRKSSSMIKGEQVKDNEPITTHNKHINSSPQIAVQEDFLFDRSKKLNYLNHKCKNAIMEAIRQKQIRGYNIVNGY